MPIFAFLATLIFVDGVALLIKSRLIMPIIVVLAAYGVWEQILH